MVRVTSSFSARSPSSQLIVFPLTWQVPLLVVTLVSLASISEDGGSVSVSVTPVAVSGPKFVTVTV